MSIASQRHSISKPLAQWLALGAMLLSIGGFLVILLYQDRIQIDNFERDRLANHARIVDENLGQRLAAIYKTMAEIQNEKVLLTGASGGNGISQLLRILDDAMQDVQTLTILDNQGIVLASNRAQLIGQDFSDQAYFQTARQGGDPGLLYVSPPFANPLGGFSINMTQARLDARRSFAGVVSVSLDPAYFVTLLDSVRYRADVWAAIAHGDGKQFMMVPDREGMTGLDLAKPGSFFSRHRESARAANVLTGIALATGEERMMALRTISPAAAHMDKPLVVAIGREQSAIFADWQLAVYRLGGLFAVLLLSSTVGMSHYQRRRRQYARALAHTEAEREQAEQARVASAKEFRLLAEAMPQIVWITRADGWNIYFNQQWLDYTGLTLEESHGHGWNRPFHPDDQQRAWDAWQDAVHNHGSYSLECRLRRADGMYRWWLIRGVPALDENGKISKWFGTCTDIHDIKQTEEQMHKLAQAVEQSPESIIITNLAAEIEYVNLAFVQTTGYSSEEVIGKNPRFLQSGRTPAENYASLWHALTQGQSWHGEFHNLRKDGTVYVESARISPVRQNDGRVSHYLAVKEDISDLIHREQAQQVLERQLLQAQKMELIGHLTGGIAHDFNNILASMLGFAEVLQMTPEINRNPQSNQYLHEILQGGIRAKELVAQLISFSHRREVATDTIRVMPIVNEVAKLLRATLPTTISIDMSIAEDLPEVLVSPVQLHQILMNLGINARDAIPGQGTIEIKVEAGVLHDSAICSSCHNNFFGNYVTISVHDSGAGIPAENLAKIFDPFFTTKKVGQGSGLGLSVLHGIVHSANGHIAVHSVLGEGTEFRIYLPVQSHETKHLVHVVNLPGDHVAIQGHVLVVDDEASIVGFLAAQLENLGCKVTGLTSATAALRLFENNPYGIDLVITDQSMPEITGAELAKAMLARRPDLPIVLNTGFSNAIDEDTALQIGIRRFLIKPVSAKVFADIVAEYLGGKKAGA